MMMMTMMKMMMIRMMNMTMIATSKVGSVLENIRRVASPSLGVCWRLMITFITIMMMNMRMGRRTYIMMMMFHDDNTGADYYL